MDSSVLDAGAFYGGVPFLSASRHYTTQTVFDEVKHIKSSAIEALLDLGNLQVEDPKASFVKQVNAAAKKTGDFAKLSKADISIVALALQLKAPLVTDDYAVANVATVMGIQVRSTSGKGIKETRKWTSYCSACGRAFGPEAKECSLCGNKLRRRYKVT